MADENELVIGRRYRVSGEDCCMCAYFEGTYLGGNEDDEWEFKLGPEIVKLSGFAWQFEPIAE